MTSDSACFCAKLLDKTCVLTGASTGIGQAIAILFAQHGCRMILLDILSCDDTLSKIAKNTMRSAVKSSSTTAIHSAFKCDISNELEIQKCIHEISDSNKCNIHQIHILVNNACKYVYQSILSATSADWDETLSINLKGHALIIKYFVPLMITDGTASIVNMGSIHSFVGKPNAVTYAVCKAAIVQLTKNCAVDLGINKYRIRVNCVAPGAVNTVNGDTGSKNKYNNGHVSKHEWLQMCNKNGIIQRKATPAEIAKCVLFFASDDSAFCTGSILCPDGGTSCL